MNHDIDDVKQGLNKKKIVIFTVLFCLLWYLNYCTPLIFDDYVYSFMFYDTSMGNPLPETAMRIAGVKDIVLSQWNHYFFWGGRTVAHTLAQFFLWQGKSVFAFVNAACFILLLLEINWIADRGKISFCFSEETFLFTAGLLWVFSIGLGDVFVWLTLSCNYLWTTVILLGFLLIYVHHYFFGTLLLKSKGLLFLFGLFAGWTNENTVCFVILVLLYYFFSLHKRDLSLQKNGDLLYGFAGLCTGYLLLMFAPGNYMRFIHESQNGVLLSGLALFRRNLVGIIRILALRSVLYGYVLKILFVKKKCKPDQTRQKMILVSFAFVFLSLSSLCIMLFSPEFRFRSSFPGLVFLIIAAGLARNISSERSQSVLKNEENGFYRMVRYFAVVYVCFTLFGSIYVYSLQHQQTQVMLAEINKEKNSPTGNALVVQERPYRLRDYKLFNALTGFHLVFPYSIVADKNYWINKDVAMYYGIRAIRTEKEEDVWQQEE